MSDKIRVLVVDDSAFMRVAVARTISADPRFEVVGQAKDGQDGVDKTVELSPDVITMDFNMPRLDGAAAVREILRLKPTPVVMLSAHTYEGAKETVEALSAGAVDFVAKPSGEVSTDLSGISAELLKKLASARRAKPQPPSKENPAALRRSTRDATIPIDIQPRPSSSAGSSPSSRSSRSSGERISFASAMLDPAVIIAISTGGPSALEQVIPHLPGHFRRGVLVVQHMPGQFTRALAERLDAMSAVKVREARPQDRIAAGVVMIAPGDKHVVFERTGMIKLTESPPVNGCRPSADVTLQSAAPIYGARLTTVVMTGMGRDGALGSSSAKAAGGKVFAQDKETSVVYGMPKAVVDLGLADEVLPLSRIAARLSRLR
ncbi:MAG: chemotaxis response regulator protein-glutamate methylesterase [Deltaproteobacteria bacterium]|nr:chemotaxis response regulator protein-glutamate methylesterase [Deltaproteobacteria bacterium]